VQPGEPIGHCADALRMPVPPPGPRSRFRLPVWWRRSPVKGRGEPTGRCAEGCRRARPRFLLVGVRVSGRLYGGDGHPCVVRPVDAPPMWPGVSARASCLLPVGVCAPAT